MIAPLLALAVYAGCPQPPATPRAVHYIDPVHGSAAGDGGAAHPWRTLAEVVAKGLVATTPAHWDAATKTNVAANPNAPIQPGDTVYLLSGDHGKVLIQGAFGAGLVGFDNATPITVAAAPGATPVIEALTVKGGAGWVFEGLTFQSLNTSGRYPLSAGGGPDVFLISLTGPHSNIIVDHAVIRSAPSSAAWTMAQWQTTRSSGFHDIGGTCVALTNSAISNIGFAVQTQRSDKVLIAGNTIDQFADDGIDYASSDLLIQNNRITNSVEDGDGFHRDAMQGQPDTETTLTQNVAIIGNTVIRETDPNALLPGTMQGIDAFDGLWRNVTVKNNVVITSTTQGISFYGVTGLDAENNILLADDGRWRACPNPGLAACAATAITFQPLPPGLNVSKSKTHQPSADVTLIGNIVTGIGVDPSTGVTAIARNLCLPTLFAPAKCVFGFPAGPPYAAASGGGGKMVWAGKAGTYGDHNVIAPWTAGAFFRAYQPATATYDLTPVRANPAHN
jgi:hypothetical protein